MPQPMQSLADPKPSWNPLVCNGTDLPVNLTILVKVLAIVVLLVNHQRILPDPWLPFIPWIDLLPHAEFQWALKVVFVASALAIVFNRRIRLASLILGITMLLAVVSSKAYYGNNKTFCGLMFLLAGLYKPGGPPFIRYQLAITYFGAGLNKALDPDWHSGVFFENWAVNRLHQPLYIALDAKLPSLLLAKFMCWNTIVTELATVPFILIPALNYWAVLANIFFQEDGNKLCLFEHENLMHIGGMSHYLSPPDGGGAAYDADWVPDESEWKWPVTRLEVAAYTAVVLRNLAAGRPAPEIPAEVDPSIAPRLERVRDELITLVATYA